MKTLFGAKRRSLVTVLGIGIGLAIVGTQAQPQNQKTIQSSNAEHLISFQLGTSVPLDIESEGVEWKGYAYHLVKLGSMRFNLDGKTDHLTAEIQAGVTTFDNVDYDVSAAVFDSERRMLGVARAECHVQREWLGRVLTTSQSIALDFGRSLDYPSATAFMLTVSKRKVLTPDDWQK